MKASVPKGISMPTFEDAFAPLYEELDDPDALFHGETMVDALLELVPLVEDDSSEAARLYRELAMLQTKRYEEECLVYAQKAVKAHKASGGIPDLKLYWLYFSCGDFAMGAGDPVAAEYLRAALEMVGRVDRPALDAVSLKQKLVVTLQTDERFEDALALAMEVLREGTEILGEDAADLQVITRYIAECHEGLGDLATAAVWLEKRLGLLEKHDDFGRMLDAYGSLASLAFRASQYSESKKWHKKRLTHARTQDNKTWIEIAEKDYEEHFNRLGLPKPQ